MYFNEKIMSDPNIAVFNFGNSLENLHNQQQIHWDDALNGKEKAALRKNNALNFGSHAVE